MHPAAIYYLLALDVNHNQATVLSLHPKGFSQPPENGENLLQGTGHLTL